jgi:DNA ligase D-like protein (predicted polymerase)/DNA ligase D-like protein (predicted 3'-phosphoesterase)
MPDKLKQYKQKRNFNKTSEPIGKKDKSLKKLRFVVQHHLARRDHYDFRLEWKGTLISWAVPKGPSYNSNDKRLAIHVEDHPLDYRNFEGNIPKGEYGGGSVMVWDEGYWKPVNDPTKGLDTGFLKFDLSGKRLKGGWTLVKIENDNWLLIKEKDNFSKDNAYIDKYKTSIKSNLTLKEIEQGKKKKTVSKKVMSDDKCTIENINISNPDKILFDKLKITKKDLVMYYQKVYLRMIPFLKNRLISAIRCPDGINNSCFFKKHLGLHNKGIGTINIPSDSDDKEDYYYIKNISGLISEVQMNTIEFHIWGSNIKNLEKPDIMVFDLDPDEGMSLKKIRQGVKDLKSILDELSIISFLKTSGGKGYHIVIPVKPSASWEKFREFAKNIAEVMEMKWPDRYVSNVRKVNRKNKIFVDWIRNTRSSTSIAPYSVRIKEKASISMPITWKELDTISPNGITMSEAIKRLHRKDPWENFFKVKQQIE